MAETDTAGRIAKTLKNMQSQPAKPETGTVSRVDSDGTVWVALSGADEEMPCDASMTAAVGDSVIVQRNGGSAYIYGNLSHPATDDTAAIMAREAAAVAENVANEAMEVAEATGQHFWDDDSGAHVTDVTREEWEEAVDDGFSDLSDTKNYHNALWNSLGMLFRRALRNLVSITRSAIAFFDGDGNDADNIVASFGGDGFQIGSAGESHLIGDYHSLQMMDKDGNVYMHISDLRGTDGYGYVTQVFDGGDTITVSGIPDKQFYKLAMRPVYVKDGQGWDYAPDPSKISVTVNGAASRVTSSVSIGYPELAEWYFTTAAVAISPTASAGDVVEITYMVEHETAKAYTLGMRDTDVPVGTMSVTEGYLTAATAYHAHAEGVQTTASGMASHAQGVLSVASGRGAHAQGCNTLAKGDYQTTLGKFNVEDENDEYAVIVGNGTSDNDRSNAFTLSWTGGANLRSAAFNSTNLDRDGSNPSANTNGDDALWFNDKDHEPVGVIRPRALTDGRMIMRTEVRTENNGSEVTNYFDVRVAKDGTQTYGMANPAAFREAIDAPELSGTNVYTQYQYVKSANIDRDAANPSSQQSDRGWYLYDKDGEVIGSMRPIRQTDGRITNQLRAVNENDVSNYINVNVARDGTQSYGLANAAAFRNALGASSGIFPLSVGGTGQSGITQITNISTLMDVATGYSVSVAIYQKWGPVVFLVIGFTCGAAVTAGTSFTLATLKSGYRPSQRAAGGDVNANATITTTGTVTIRPVINFNTTTTRYVSFVYFVS